MNLKYARMYSGGDPAGCYNSVALDKVIKHFRLGSFCYYYEGTSGSEYEDIIALVITGNSILTAHHVPMTGEYEVKNVQAMKIMDLLDAGGSFTKF